MSDRAVATPGATLHEFYSILLAEFGPQGWWPARTRWEVVWGAILTQNTTWRNATLALKNLRREGLLRGRGLHQVPLRKLESLIRPAGFHRQKARAIHTFAQWIEQAHGVSLDRLFSRGAASARAQLLDLRGIGPETADAILLYAGKLPVFVADTYTRRILARHELIAGQSDYHSAQRFLHQHLPPEQALYNEFHALLVEAAKRFCHRQVAHCQSCPLGKFMGHDAKFENRRLAQAPEEAGEVPAVAGG